jgi:translation elongation factor P/translation initiation factor 5A
MAIPATQIRRGMVIVFEGDPCRIIEFRHHTPGNLRAMVQAKLKNIRTGSSSSIGFAPRTRSIRRRWKRTISSSCIRVVRRTTS